MPGKRWILIFLLLAVSPAGQAGDANEGERLSTICVDCHGEDGLGDEEIPAIAGMDASVIRMMLVAFKTGARVDENEEMLEVAAELSVDEIENVAAYYATLPGK